MSEKINIEVDEDLADKITLASLRKSKQTYVEVSDDRDETFMGIVSAFEILIEYYDAG